MLVADTNLPNRKTSNLMKDKKISSHGTGGNLHQSRRGVRNLPRRRWTTTMKAKAVIQQGQHPHHYKAKRAFIPEDQQNSRLTYRIITRTVLMGLVTLPGLEA